MDFLVLFLIWMILTSIHTMSYSNILLEKYDNGSSLIIPLQVKETKNLGYRLPQSVKPVGYRLRIETQIGVTGKEDSEDFNGRVEIDVNVAEKTNEIILHSKNLSIYEFHMTKFDRNEKLNLVTMSVDIKRDFLIIERTNSEFEIGMYTLTFVYSGLLREDSSGFFKLSYLNDNGITVWYAITHFEPVNARMAFPCFDEPAFKAKFNISITHYKNYSANSNTLKISTSEPNDQGMVTTSFEETPKMSTYLVTFLVSDFESLGDEKNFRILTRPGTANRAHFSLRIGQLVLNEFDNYTGISYSNYMRKMDQVAIHDENFSKAMENWGIIIYRDEYLLSDDGERWTGVSQQSVAELIAHEFCHQWFGNLVSPKWWNDLWLSEGFATYFKYYMIEKIEPKWRSMDNFVVTSILHELFRDDNDQESAVSNSVETPEQIMSQFGDIAYVKGAAIVRMMQHFLTESIFQRGLQNYINKKKEDSADSYDLFQLMDEVTPSSSTSSKPDKLSQIMDTWVNRAGYPLITITRNYSDNSIHLRQECFDTKKNCTNIWYVPINYATQKNANFNTTTPELWLTNKSMDVSLDVGADNWIILNKQTTGYYRVNYDERNWLLIIDSLRSSKKSLESIHVLNRAQLHGDAFKFVSSGRLSLEILLKLMMALKNETDYIAWITAIDAIQWLKLLLRFTEYHPIFKRYIEWICQDMDAPLIKMIQRKGYVDLIRILNPDRVRVYFNHKNCSSDQDLRNLLSWLADKTSHSSQMTPLIACCDYRNNENEEYTKLWLQISEKNFTSNKLLSRKILCFQNRDLLRYYLDITAKNDTEREHSSEQLITGVFDEPGANFIVQKFRKIVENDFNYSNDLIQFLASRITTDIQFKKIEEWKKSDEHQEHDGVVEALAIAQEKLQWLRENKRILDEWSKEVNETITHWK
ncbi:hypothetical protein QAD02_006064 [Eretmocerus hayati]|uniref:Uncharacterized protein n=1 Tax=Eretmocerus hayati TaxID=131215 RepID=A0ACC2N089_9HYME|nr:hypothetical protein QAD02_006064 [Eretmocerus hayati]